MNQLVLPLFFSLLPLSFLGQENMVIKSIFEASVSFTELENGVDTTVNTITEFTFSDFRIALNGVTYNNPQRLQTWNKDTLLSDLNTYQINEIKKLETDTTFEYFKIISIDSVRCFNCVVITFPISINIDSVLTEIYKAIESGVEWESLYQKSSCDPHNYYVIQSYGWNPIDRYDSEFTDEILKHPTGSIFSVSIKKFESSYIIHKTEDVQMKPIKQVLYIRVPKTK